MLNTKKKHLKYSCSASIIKGRFRLTIVPVSLRPLQRTSRQVNCADFYKAESDSLSPPV